MARYQFQDAFERFIDALDDALLLYAEAGLINNRKSEERGSPGGTNRESRAVYRAIVVTSVAAWEDFNEQLVGSGYDYLKETAANQVPVELGGWFPPSKLQSPSSPHVRKLYWAYFGFDPMPSWWFSFGARAREVGGDTDRWFSFNQRPYLEKRTLRGPDAAQWLDSLVVLRHATAHYDPRHYRRPPEIGVATPNAHGKWGLAEYNAENAIVVLTQLALCTIQGLAEHLDVPGGLRYLKPLQEWSVEGSTLTDLPQWPSAGLCTCRQSGKSGPGPRRGGNRNNEAPAGSTGGYARHLVVPPSGFVPCRTAATWAPPSGTAVSHQVIELATTGQHGWPSSHPTPGNNARSE